MSERSPRPSDRPRVGWCEYVDLPDWGIKALRAKADTGAKTSSLHVEDLEWVSPKHVTFEVVLHRKKRDRRVRVKARVVRETHVRSSLGHSETRPFVRTTVRLGDVEREIEVNLVDRGHLIHRMLLGRTALHGFAVDVDHRYLLGRPKKKTKKKAKKKLAKKKASRPAAKARKKKAPR